MNRLPGLLKVARAAYETLEYLAKRPENLSVTLAGERKAQPSTGYASRRVSFGTVPDFTYEGEGVRLDDGQEMEVRDLIGYLQSAHQVALND